MTKGTEIQRLFRELGRHYHEQIIKEMTITPQQGRVIQVIHQFPGISQSDLANVLHRKKPTISSILNNLEKGALIYREVPKDNARQKKIYLSEAGTKLYEEVNAKFRNLDKLIVSNLDSHDQNELIRILNKMIEKKEVE